MDTKVPDSTAAPKLSMPEKLALAKRLYREFHTICFWHMKPDLIVTEANLPDIVKGLRTYGGKKGATSAAQLLR